MSDVETTATETPASAEPTIEQIAAQVFGADAPAATEPEKPAEAAPEPPKPDPVAEKVSARIAVARQAELRAAKSRAELAAAKAEVDQQRAEVAEQLKVVENLKAAKLSPSKALELLGMTPKEFLESLATEHEPEAVARRVNEGTRSEVDKLRQELQELRDAEKGRAEAIRRQQVDTNYNAATQEFLTFVDAAPEKYPHLIAEYTPAELAQAAQQAASLHAEAYKEKFGDYPEDDVIAEYLEDQAKARAEALAERRARIGKTASLPSKGEPSGDLKATQPETGPSPRTLTSRAASEKATAHKGWSQEQADEESLRILSSALKAG